MEDFFFEDFFLLDFFFDDFFLADRFLVAFFLLDFFFEDFFLLDFFLATFFLRGIGKRWRVIVTCKATLWDKPPATAHHTFVCREIPKSVIQLSSQYLIDVNLRYLYALRQIPQHVFAKFMLA